MTESIETRFQAAIDAGTIHGAIICASDTRGDFVRNATIGERTLLSGEKKGLQLDDVCFMASAGKLIVTIAALQCVEDGLVALDEDVSSIIPELVEEQVFTGFENDGDTPILERVAQPITLKKLITHSAGTVHPFMNSPVGKWHQTDAPSEEGSRGPVEKYFALPLSHQPGSGWMYGSGLDWTGRIVERLTGRSLGEHVLERVLAPLGSRDAQFYPVTREDLRPRLIDLNPDDPECLGLAVLGGSGDLNKQGKGDFGGHGLFMSAATYVKVLHSLLANDGKLLKTATVDDMFRDHLSPESAAAFTAALTGPMGSFFRVGIDSRTKTGYGLGGLLTLEDIDGWYGTNTLTWGGGLTVSWFIDRKNDLCGVCALQAKLPVDANTMEQLKQVFRKGIYGERAARRRDDAPRDARA